MLKRQNKSNSSKVRLFRSILIKEKKLHLCKCFFKKYGSIPASFPFIFALPTSQFNFKLKKSVVGVLGIRTWGPQDGRLRQNHRAMAPTSLCKCFGVKCFSQSTIVHKMCQIENIFDIFRTMDFATLLNTISAPLTTTFGLI